MRLRYAAGFTVALTMMITGCGAGTEPNGEPARPSAQPTTAESTPAETPSAGTPTPTSTPSTSTSASAGARSQDDLDQRLRDAAWQNDVRTARKLIKDGADVNAKDDTQQSAYLIATSEGYLRLLRLTLRNGADVGDLDSWHGTGLIRASERGHGLVVGELLQAGIDRDHVNRIGYQAIHEAVWLGEDSPAYLTTLRVLAAGGAELTEKSVQEQLTPLQMAAERGFPRQEKVLTKLTGAEEPADPDRALLQAARDGDADAVAVALRAGADIEARDGHDRTALLLAATHDRVAVARVLVAMGADPDALDDRHDTPWLVTGVTGSVEMGKTLMPADPDLTIENRFGGLSPIPASERGHVEYVRWVVGTDVDINHVNRLGWTALLEAVILGDGGEDHQEIVRILLDASADPGIADGNGVTPLQHAEQQGYDRIAKILRG